MTSAFGRRLDRVEASMSDGGDYRILFVATDKDAVRAYQSAASAGTPLPLCIVSKDIPPGDGGTVAAMMQRVALSGRRIYDPRPESSQDDATTLWRPAIAPQAQAGLQ